MSVFGEKIRDRREELRLSQEQLAKLSGLTRRSIVSYETTDKIPHGSSIRKLAAALGVTVRYLEHDEIDDPNAGIEEEPFIVEVRERYGKRGADEMAAVLAQNEALFAGGSLSEEQKDMFFEAVSRAYFQNKERSRVKFGRRAPKKQMP
jgi:transcriptional regulator with XRE-family HTH domain